MNRSVIILLLAFIIPMSICGCKKDKPKPMVDIDTIKTDGSHDDRFLFRKEIEKEESRGKKYQKKNF